MKPGRLQKATAAMALTTALLNGAIAHNYDQEARTANGAEQVYTALGDIQRADEQSAYSDRKENNRDIYLGLAVTNLGLVATFGALGISSARNSRRVATQTLPPIQSTTGV